MAHGVALPAEGVDRNDGNIPLIVGRIASPSPRRAWIEMDYAELDKIESVVALPAEGVDRNLIRNGIVTINDPSPSPRRAWIEI